MKILVKILDIGLAIFFAVVAFKLFLLEMVAKIADGSWWNYLQSINPWWAAVMIIAIFAWLYVPYYLMQKSETKYNYTLAVLLGFWGAWQFYRFIVVNNYHFESSDIKLAILFGLPALITLILYYLNKTSVKKYN